MRIGVAGLGSMGTAIARRIADQGGDVSVWNRSPEPAQNLKDEGFSVASSLQELFQSCDVVFSVLSNDAAVTQTFTADFLAILSSKPIHVNMATISLEAAKQMQRLHKAAGIEYLGAPVLGRPVVATAGKLLVVAGGQTSTLEKVQPVLELFSAKTFHMGQDAWVSAVVKLGVNYNLIHAFQALGESITLIEKAGVDATLFVEILTTSAFTGTAYTGYGPMIANQSYSPAGFNMSMGLKDMNLVLGASKDLGIELPAAPLLKQLFEVALASDELRDFDWGGVAEVTRRQLEL
jgi:3-hydroxyisobutyrate dehydrogenase-like beta-hydroxyacid dehydrogenase